MICEHYQSPPFPLHSLVNSTHLQTAWSKWNACWYLHWGVITEEWEGEMLWLLNEGLTGAAHTSRSPSSQNRLSALHQRALSHCLMFMLSLYGGGSFSFFQCCSTHFIFTNRATRIEPHSSTWNLKTKALHKLKQGSTEALKSIITAGWSIRLLVRGLKVHRSL